MRAPTGSGGCLGGNYMTIYEDMVGEYYAPHAGAYRYEITCPLNARVRRNAVAFVFIVFFFPLLLEHDELSI